MKKTTLIFGLVFLASCSAEEKKPLAAKPEKQVDKIAIAEQPAATTAVEANQPEAPQKPRTIQFLPPVITDRPDYDYDAPPMQEEIYAVSTSDKEVDFATEYAVPAPPPPPMESNRPLDVVDEQADFPGGKTALMKYMKDNLKMPETATEAGIEGKVYVKFVVSKTGEISNVTIIKKLIDCPECDAEAKRVVKAMPKWIPAKNKGVTVDSYFNLPVVFKQ